MGNHFAKTFSSSLGKKLIMSLTGLFMCLFLVVHLTGNLQLFKDDGGQAFNAYTYFMTHFWAVKIISYILYASIIVHAIYALVLTLNNKKARTVGYAVYAGEKSSPWASRNMGILGTVLLIFIVVHMSNFWAQYHWGGLPYTRYETELQNPENVTITELPVSTTEIMHSEYIDVQNGNQVLIAKDLYKVVYLSFKQWWYVTLYVIAMLAMSFHLVHGFKSGFQTLGLDHKRYLPIIKLLSVWLFGVLIPIGFALMPLYIFFFK